MNILIYMPAMSNGGAERVIAHLANHWASRGWKVTVVTVRSTEKDAYLLDSAVQRIALALQSNAGSAIRGLVNNLRRVFALRSVLRRVRPQVALSMMPSANVVLALASVGLPGLATVGSERVHPPQVPLGRIWEFLRARAYGRLGALVALSDESAAWLRMHTSVRKVEVIPNPIRLPLPSHPPFISPPVLPQGARLLLAVGRLDPQKGFDMLIDVFAVLAQRYPAWVLVILGEGPERKALEARARAHGIDSRVLMPGRAGNVKDWYEAAHLFVMSSRFEGFPNALAEAMAHEVPAISFDCETGPRSIIRQGEDGVLVPPEDTEKLRVELARLMGDDDLRQRLGRRAAEVRSRFSMTKIITKWEELFLELSQEAVVGKPIVRSEKNEI